MSALSTDTTDLLSNRSWRRRHSLWLLAPVLGFGLFSFVGFVYCAIRVRERKWTVLAAVSIALTVVGWTLVSTWTTSAGDATAAASAFVLGMWLTSIIFAVLINRDYLAWRACQQRPVQQPAAQLPRVSYDASAPPGWYTDPRQSHLIRWWDGKTWTDHVTSRTSPGG
jgi:hypothetical protein